MSTNVFLINGAKELGHSKGRLNTTLHDLAKEILKKFGYQIKEVIVDKGYDIQQEVEHLLWADYIIYQMPGWWMGEPWIIKKYMDEVFTSGSGRLYANDGRSRENPNKKYGSGGLSQGKKYMFSLTWNAPREAFEDEQQFFEGKGVDGVYMHLHKAHQFLGMTALPTFICYDVIKDPQVEQYKKDYEAHLNVVFA